MMVYDLTDGLKPLGWQCRKPDTAFHPLYNDTPYIQMDMLSECRKTYNFTLTLRSREATESRNPLFLKGNPINFSVSQLLKGCLGVWRVI